MNMKKNIFIATAAAMAMAGATAAEAAVTIDYTTGTSTTTEYSTARVTVGTAVTPGVAVGTIAASGTLSHLAAGDSVSFTVAGAVFDPTTLAANLPVIADGTIASIVKACTLNTANTVLTCVIDAADIDAIAAGAQVVSTAGAAVTFTTANTALLDMTGAVAGTNATIDVAVTRTVTVLGNTTTSVVHSAAAPHSVINVNAGIVKNTAVTTAGSHTATVADLFQSFGGTANTADTGGTAGVTADSAVGGSATGWYRLSLTGLPTAASTVTMTGVNGAVAAGNAASTPAVSGGFSLDGAGNGVAFLNAASTGTAVTLPTNNAIVINMDGTPITASTPQLTIDYVAGTSDLFTAHGILAATTIATIIRNGSNVSLTTISAGTTVKLTNNDATGAGAVTITATTAAGVDVPDTGLAVNAMPTAVAPGNTVSILGTDLLAAFPGAAKIDFVIEASDVTGTDQVIIPGVGANVNTVRTGGSAAM